MELVISQNNFDFLNHQIILIFDTTKSILLYHKFGFVMMENQFAYLYNVYYTKDFINEKGFQDTCF